MNWYEDPIIISAIIVGIPTTILAIITYLYMNETKLIRKTSSDPNFSIAPETYVFMENTIHEVSLINSGQTAKAIQVKCNWSKTDDEKKTSHNYYIVSLGSNDKASLHEIPISKLVENKGKISIEIICKDSRNNNYENKLEIDFEDISKRGFTIAYQHDNKSSITKSLRDISYELRSIERSISQLKRR